MFWLWRAHSCFGVPVTSHRQRPTGRDMCERTISVVVIALAFLVSSFWQLYSQSRAQRWHSIKGMVVGYQVRRTMGPERESFYEVDPTYAYTVEGMHFTGSRLSFADKSEALTKAQAIERARQRFPDGKEVTVYYDPRAPERSVVDREARYLLPLAGMAVAVVLIMASHPFSCGIAVRETHLRHLTERLGHKLVPRTSCVSDAREPQGGRAGPVCH
jgi:hypothetical protein